MSCEHRNRYKRGFTPFGVQRFHCLDCGRMFQDSNHPLNGDGFLAGTLHWMKSKGLVFDDEEALDAGRLALLVSEKEGELVNGVITDRVKRYVRREILKAASAYPHLQQRPDYGFDDGRRLTRGIRKPAKDACARLRHKRMTAGVCTRCGKERVDGSTYCEVCREKRRKTNREGARLRASKKGSAKSRLSDTDIKELFK